MYQQILVAVDGSHTSDHALNEAIQLAKALNSKLRLMHAVDVVGSTWQRLVIRIRRNSGI